VVVAVVVVVVAVVVSSAPSLFSTHIVAVSRLQEAAAVPKRSRDQIWKRIDHDYFGYRDDEDGTLVVAEAEAEKEGA
jgi:hypothetical protein